MKHNLFAKRQQVFDGGFTNFMQDIRSKINSGSISVQSDVANYALASESFDPMLDQELQQVASGLSVALEGLMAEHHLGGSSANRAAGVAAATAIVMAGQNPQALIQQTAQAKNVVSTESMRVVHSGGADFYQERPQVALESYDERQNRDALVFSVAYNLNAAQQDEFGEAFFRTIVLSPDQVGFHVNVNLIQVQNDVKRSISGATTDFGRRNIIQAVIDPTILRDDQTKLVPVYRDESKDKFLPVTSIAPRDVEIDGMPVTTSVLKTGITFGLLEISQTDALLKAGVFDVSDAIDPSVKLKNIYVEVKGATAADNELIKFSVEDMPYTYFNQAVQGQNKDMSLTFQTKRLLVDKRITLPDGSASDLLKVPVVDADVVVRLKLNVFGKCNLEYGDTSLHGTPVEIQSVAYNGEFLAKTDAKYLAVVAAFQGAEVVGFDLDAFRTNSNKRSRGQLVNTNLYSQLYTVPWRAPVSVPRPVAASDQTDATDLQSLISTTRIRCNNAAVTKLLATQGLLQDYVASDDGHVEDAEILGVARMLLTKPYYKNIEIDMTEQLDSLKSSERRTDIQAVLVNRIRDEAVRAYRDSGFKAVADALAGGISEKPVLTIGTDPVIASYLVRDGDMRLAGDQFSVKVVETMDRRMAGKIFMAFTIPDAPEGTIHPLNFGYMAWRPEMPMILPISRNGQTSKELTVTPSYNHIVNVPVLVTFDVVGIEDVVADKVAINTHAV